MCSMNMYGIDHVNAQVRLAQDGGWRAKKENVRNVGSDHAAAPAIGQRRADGMAENMLRVLVVANMGVVQGLILPFAWTLNFPVSLLLGRLTPQQAATGFGAQLVWLVVSLLLARLVWRAGVRRYGAVGG